MLLPILVGDEAFGAVAHLAARRPGADRRRAGRADRRRWRMRARGSHARSRPTSARPHAASDRLTGLANRRGFDELIAQAEPRGAARGRAGLRRPRSVQAAQRHAGPPAGDAALIHFARIIREQIRAGDVAARIGGEEFAVWLPESRSSISAPGSPSGSGSSWAPRRGTGTGGPGRSAPRSAWRPAPRPAGQRSGKLPAQADAALYVAKNSGRNRVERAGR